MTGELEADMEQWDKLMVEAQKVVIKALFEKNGGSTNNMEVNSWMRHIMKTIPCEDEETVSPKEFMDHLVSVLREKGCQKTASDIESLLEGAIDEAD